MSAANRLPALVALGRLHAREGFPAARTTLDEALALALPIGTAETLGLVRAARAERAWLAGDPAGMLEEAQAAYALGVQQRHDWVTGELAFWRWRRGVTDPPPDWIAPAYALQIAGDWRGAADAWRELDCSYERARALADGDAEAQARALQTFDRLGAAPVAARLRQQLRSQGIARVPRGPRSSTLANRFALTGRQVEILRLLAAGLSNAEIATRLSIAPKTAEHHVAAVLAKLDVTSRRAAVEVARTEGLLDAE